MLKRFRWFIVMSAVTLPWIFMRLLGIHTEPLLTTLIAGATIAASAFLLTWASEAAEKDISGVAILVLALIAVAPEYAVDGSLAISAGKDMSYAPYAVANMTGANRLLIGLGWPTIVILFWLKTGKWRFWRKDFGKMAKSGVDIPLSQRLDCGILALATLYAIFIPFKGFLAWYDGVILVALFLFYFWRVVKLPNEEMEIIGPAKAVAAISKKWRRRMVWGGLMVYAGAAILLSAEPFAHGLIETGKTIGIDEFLLVQWLAPLASEAPEFIVAILFVLQLHATKGLAVLVSSKINQWTLLIGTLPFIFLVSAFFAKGIFIAFPLSNRQSLEIWLTAAQSLFAVVLLANLNLSLKEAALLAGLFLTQLMIPLPQAHFAFIFVYLSFAAFFFLASSRRSMSSWRAIGKMMFTGKL